LGGSIAGTRPAVDAGWIPNERLVGQTGKIVSPKLYIACGISGMQHHVLGMRDSRLIIAIIGVFESTVKNGQKTS
jgi:electron transfer flavoprotein alpha subunit